MNYSDLIPDYLGNKMTTQQRQAFEIELSKNTELKDEVSDLVPIYLSVSLVDQLAAGHISVELLTLYAEESSEFDDATRDEIKVHLDRCPECREEVELCREVIRASEIAQENETMVIELGESWLKRVVDFLFPARVVVRTAYAYSAVAALAVLIYVGFGLRDPGGPAWQSYKIKPVAERDAAISRVIQTIEVQQSHDFIELAVLLDLKTGSQYRFTVLNAENELSPVVPYVKYEIPFALLIPTDYLAEGKNTLRVVEVQQAGETHKPDTFNIGFIVRYSD